ncbi:hypothetical protein VI817_008034 [Penicillium citrinum]|nr:hypothetical protein VI817_008034 [Penicillium citrinum]
MKKNPNRCQLQTTDHPVLQSLRAPHLLRRAISQPRAGFHQTRCICDHRENGVGLNFLRLALAIAVSVAMMQKSWFDRRNQ